MPAFPASWSGFFGELASGYRTTLLGGTLAASPALGAMGATSWLTFGSTDMAQKVLLAGGPVLASVMLYRALARLTGRPGAAVLGAVAYALSALVLWSFSEGRIDLLVALAVIPAFAERFEAGFGREPPSDGRWRFLIGLGVTIAVGVAFLPGVMLALGMLTVVHVLFGSSRGRGLGLILASTGVAAALLFPFVATIVSGDGAAMGSRIGTTNLGELGRLALGSGPGTWVIAAFLPVSAVLALALVGPEFRGVAFRAALTATAALGLAWFASAGYLPEWAANAEVYLALAAVSEAFIVGFGLASVLGGLGRESFGLRQIGTALLAIVLGGGLLLQSVSAMVGGWSVGGPEALPPAWALVTSSATGDFRVLWVGADTGRRFVAPGGDPLDVATGRTTSLRFGLTDQTGVSALDVGRSVTGGGAGYMRSVVDQILSGATVHGGALLAPLGVRFVVAEHGDLPEEAEALLDAQVDLDRVGTSGLTIFRNSAAMPPAAILPSNEQVAQAVGSDDLGQIARLPSPRTGRLTAVSGGWAGVSPVVGIAVVSTEFSSEWRAEIPDGNAVATSRGFRLVDIVRSPEGSGSDPLHGSVGANARDARAGAALGRGAVGDQEARGAMRAERHAARSRGQGVVAIAFLTVVVGGGLALERGLGPHAPTAPGSRGYRLGRLALPARWGSGGMAGHVVSGEPRRRRRDRPYHVDVRAAAGGYRSTWMFPRRRRSRSRFPPSGGRPRRSSSTSAAGSPPGGSRRAAGARSGSGPNRVLPTLVGRGSPRTGPRRRARTPTSW